MRTPLLFLLCVLFLSLHSATLSAQTGKLTGLLTEEGSKEPLAGVSIRLSRTDDSTRSMHGYSNANGRFTIKNITAGSYKILFSSLGYRAGSESTVTIRADETTELNISLTSVPVRGEAVIVTASRRPEKLTDAPATISYVSAKEIEEHPGITPLDQLTGLAGVYVAQTGVGLATYSTRGRPFVYNGAVLTLQDNRNTSVPGLRVNVNTLLPTIDDDIDHIEVIRGPASALYGPDATEGAINIITKSPFTSQGTMLSVTGGERNFFQGTLRHAGVIGESFGYKISGSYIRATEFEFTDTFESNARNLAIKGGANPDTLLIGKRNPNFERFTADARIDWKISDDATLVLNSGISDFLHGIHGTSIGTVQVQDWQYKYYDARIDYNDLFVQAYLNQNDAGKTFNLRTGAQLVNRSTEFVLQAQHSYLLFPQERLIYGADLSMTNPVTDGTVDGRNEDNDQINIFGGYLQSETHFFDDKFNLVLAARLDKHNRLNSAVFSPRIGLVFKPDEQNIFHLTYNKAYATPTSQDLFFDYLYQAQPFKVRLVGLPINGFTFTPGIMHSDFSGNPATGIAVDQASSAAIWANYMKEIALLAGNPALAGIPAPPIGSVHSSVGLLNPLTGSFDPASDTVASIGGPVPYYVQTVEFSYEFKPNEKLDLVADVYHRTGNDGLSSRFITPSVLYNSKDIVNYLTAVFKAGGMSDSAASVNANQLNAAAIQHIPVGTVAPNESTDPTAILNSSYPAVNNLSVNMGADLFCSYQLNREFSVAGTYSYLSKLLNTPPVGYINTSPLHKTSLEFKYHDHENGLFAELRHRWTDTYYSSDVAGFFQYVPAAHILDVIVGYTIPSYTNLQFTLTVLNLLNNQYQTNSGAPPIGRLGTLRAHYTF